MVGDDVTVETGFRLSSVQLFLHCCHVFSLGIIVFPAHCSSTYTTSQHHHQRELETLATHAANKTTSKKLIKCIVKLHAILPTKCA